MTNWTELWSNLVIAVAGLFSPLFAVLAAIINAITPTP